MIIEILIHHLSNQNNVIVTCEGEIDVIPSVLNFSYELFVGENSMGFDEEMLDVLLFSGTMRSRILKILIHEEKTFQEIISPSTTRNNMCEGIMKMLMFC